MFKLITLYIDIYYSLILGTNSRTDGQIQCLITYIKINNEDKTYFICFNDTNENIYKMTG